jgi:hypothetical protein
MKHVMTVINNKILAAKEGTNINLCVRDTSRRIFPSRKSCHIQYDGTSFKVTRSDFNNKKTLEMLQSVRKYMKFIVKAL